jgi:hypothetical protein
LDIRRVKPDQTITVAKLFQKFPNIENLQLMCHMPALTDWEGVPPQTVGQLKELTVCKLDGVPISNMPNLVHLGISFSSLHERTPNQLRSMFRNLPRLTKLNLKNFLKNPPVGPDQAIDLLSLLKDVCNHLPGTLTDLHFEITNPAPMRVSRSAAGDEAILSIILSRCVKLVNFSYVGLFVPVEAKQVLAARYKHMKQFSIETRYS